MTIRTDAEPPFVTVAVPVRNEARCIEHTLTRLTQQNYDPDRFEVVVADGRSTDATVSLVRQMQERHANIRLVDNPKQLSSAARNLAVQHGRGELIVIVDGHCDIADRDYLKKMVAAFERSGADCLGRPQPLEIAGASVVQDAIATARRCWLGHNPSSHIYSSAEGFVKASSVAVAYRRTVFDKVGFFDERFDACEDVEFNHRIDAAGLTCFFTPDIAVHYHPRSSVPGLVYQMSRYGRGRLRLARKHPESLSLPAIAPMIFAIAMIGCGLLGLVWWPFATLFCLGVLAYFSVIAATSLTLLPRPGMVLSKCLLPIVFLAVHVGFAWGTTVELLRRISRFKF